MSGGVHGLPEQRQRATLEAMKEVGKDTAEEVKAEQLASTKSAQAMNAQTAFRSRVPRKPKTLKAHSKRVQKMKKMAEKGKRLLPIERIKDKASQFEKRNPELKSKVLTMLREQIKPEDTKDDILKKLEEFYKDVSLADEALEFLLETTDGKLYQEVLKAKEEFNEMNGREITAGRNIHTQARQASDKGLGSPTSMRDMYRDITGNPRDANTLFKEFSEKYAFKDMKKVMDFLLHSMGADMKAKGTSIPRGELFRLLTEVRSLQAILGVYRFFKGRMGLMQSMFAKEGQELPDELTFEEMAKQFMNICSERYPSADKVNQRAVRLGIEDWILAKIIAFSQFRDAVRETAMNKIFKSLQHRDETFMAIIEALEDLEDELEELEEREAQEGEEEEDWEEGEEEGEEEEEEEIEEQGPVDTLE